jgi:hypothetical protein
MGSILPTKTLRFKSNTKDIMTKAWSFILWSLGLIFIILDTAMPFLQGYMGLPEWAFGVASGVCAAGGLLARVLIQDNLAG